MIFTRKEFAHYFNAMRDGMGNDNSPLWVPEADTGPLEWFVCVKPLALQREAHEVTKEVYWDWCDTNLKGKTRCYSTDYQDKKEWWGFSDKSDIPYWMLRWL